MLNCSEWTKFVRDVEMCDSVTTQKDVTQIFINSQDAIESSADTPMSFPEFVEAIVALGLFRTSNPYWSVSGRLYTFFNEKLFASLKKRLPNVYAKTGL